MTVRTSLITDWRSREEDLPDITAGNDYEVVIRPQMFIILHRIVVHNYFSLAMLRIGAVEQVPFKLEYIDRALQTYQVNPPAPILDLLLNTGATIAPSGLLALPPGLEVWVTLRNTRGIPSKPRAALVVQQKGS